MARELLQKFGRADQKKHDLKTTHSIGEGFKIMKGTKPTLKKPKKALKKA